MTSRIASKIMLVVAILFVSLLAACGAFEYNGDYPELFSVAINSVLGTQGGFSGRQGIQPELRVLEEDNYGRVMFMYSEDNAISPVSFLIMQKVEGDYVYFYQHYNFFSDSIRHLRQEPDEDKLAYLKEINNWNQEMSESSEFFRTQIVRRPESGPVPNDIRVEVFMELFPASNVRPSTIAANNPFLRTDRYGRSVYLLSGLQWKYDDVEHERVFVHIAVLFQPDHNFDIEKGTLVITDYYNYQTDLRLFMEANGWDTPFNP